jgi:hypothetical protein
MVQIKGGAASIQVAVVRTVVVCILHTLERPKEAERSSGGYGSWVQIALAALALRMVSFCCLVLTCAHTPPDSPSVDSAQLVLHARHAPPLQPRANKGVQAIAAHNTNQATLQATPMAQGHVVACPGYALAAWQRAHAGSWQRNRSGRHGTASTHGPNIATHADSRRSAQSVCCCAHMTLRHPVGPANGNTTAM